MREKYDFAIFQLLTKLNRLAFLQEALVEERVKKGYGFRIEAENLGITCGAIRRLQKEEYKWWKAPLDIRRFNRTTRVVINELAASTPYI